MTLTTAILSALLFSSAPAISAQRLGRGRSRTGSPPPGSSTDINTSTTSTTTTVSSSASCQVSVDTRATATAQNAYASLIVASYNYFCSGQAPDGNLASTLRTEASAVAEVMLTFKTRCTAEGENAWACGRAWAEAEAFAEASYDIAVQAIAELDSSDCECSTDIFGNADASVESFGTMLAGIYAGADVSACVSGAGDIDPREVDEVTVLRCTAESVATITFGAIANAWRESNCRSTAPAICDTCCSATAGDASCDCEVCINAQQERGEVFVRAFTDVSNSGDAICERTFTDVLTGAVETSVEEVPDSDVVIDQSGNGGGVAQCTVNMTSSAATAAINAHAEASARAVIRACRGDIARCVQPFREATASAVVSVYQTAYAACNVVGAGVEACGLAESFGAAFASACAAASADAIAEIDTSDCDCDTDLSIIADSFSEESQRIFAAVEQVVSANACADGETPDAFSEITRRCTVNSYALASASAIARAWLTGECHPPLPACVEKCEDTDDAESCVEECSAQAWRAADALAETRVEIEVTSSTSCSGDAIGDTWFADFSDGGVEQEHQAGDVQATLRWRGDADLDLYVRTPSGTVLYYGNRAGDGGRLEWDTVPGCAETELHTENAFWPVDAAEEGEYKAWARLYSDRDCGDFDSGLPIDFNLVLKIRGEVVDTLPGSFATSQSQRSRKLVGTV